MFYFDSNNCLNRKNIIHANGNYSSYLRSTKSGGIPLCSPCRRYSSTSRSNAGCARASVNCRRLGAIALGYSFLKSHNRRHYKSFIKTVFF